MLTDIHLPVYDEYSHTNIDNRVMGVKLLQVLNKSCELNVHSLPEDNTLSKLISHILEKYWIVKNQFPKELELDYLQLKFPWISTTLVYMLEMEISAVENGLKDVSLTNLCEHIKLINFNLVPSQRIESIVNVFSAALLSKRDIYIRNLTILTLD